MRLASDCRFPRTRDILGMSPDRLVGPPTSSQVTAHGEARIVTVCKTVGLAYVGSNPTPATTSGNSP